MSSRYRSATAITEFSRQKKSSSRADSRLGLSRWRKSTSRREDEKRACRYLRWQNLLLFLSILASVVIYIVFVFPFLVQWTGQLNSQKYVAPDHSVMPQMPLLNTPPAYVADSNLKLTGFGTPSTQVQFILNDEENKTDVVPVGINGEFSHALTLQEGTNTIQAYSFDDHDRQSKTTKVYTVTLDSKKPELDIETPENHQEFSGRSQQLLKISGHTEAGAKVVANNVATTADQDGAFSLDYHLNEGRNELQITSTDRAENETTVTITVVLRL